MERKFACGVHKLVVVVFVAVSELSELPGASVLLFVLELFLPFLSKSDLKSSTSSNMIGCWDQLVIDSFNTDSYLDILKFTD